MDLNTALMESITSMSEYFVAANTRTSFTDMAESSSVANINSSLNSSASNHHHHHNLNQQFSTSAQIHNSISNNNNKQNFGTNAHHLGPSQSQLQQHGNNSNNTLSSMHSPTSNQNNFHHSHSYGLNHSNMSTNLQSQARLSQPVRTQIPIHCYIEQLDACADMPGYNSPLLNDSELFNTTNSTSTLNKSIQLSNNTNSNHHNQHSHQQHLHQSKLALESVTNCNGSTANLSSLANSSSLFNENETNNNDNNELDNIDSLDHLSSNSPLSVLNQQSNIVPPSSSNNNPSLNSNTAQTNSICSSSNHRPQQASSSYDSHHFQSCRETYAIVTSNVLYIDLVRTVLLQLGYSAMDLINAKGKSYSFDCFFS